MEKLKAKHDHKLTDILKVFIFALFLMMPGLIILPSMLYYGVNKYATAPTKQVEVYEEREVDFNQLSNFNYQIVDDNDHTLVPAYNNDDRLNHKIYFDVGVFKPNIQLWLSDTTYDSDWRIPNTDAINRSQYLNTIYTMSKSYFKLRLYPFNNLLTTYGNVNMDIYIYDLTQMFGVGNEPTSVEEFKAIFPNDSYPYTESEIIEIKIDTGTTETYTDITSQIQYNWTSLWKQPLFNWTNYTILKEGLDSFTNVFGITNISNITNLIAYELIIVAVYMVIDIILTLFKWLTHLIGEK